MKPFDLLNAPLQGRNLIEANAGTGKTYAISGLFLRLIVEHALQVGEILVMTYTAAATEELKDRIRCTLSRALEALRHGRAEDLFLDSFVRRLAEDDRTNSARRRLATALRDFDEAAIFTIHGFCQRTLQENAFESHSTFNAELITESEKITDLILQDFWRRHFYEAQPELVAYALETKNNLAGYRAFLRQISSHPDIRIVLEPPAPNHDIVEEEIANYRREISKLRDSWKECRETVCSLLRDGSLNGKVYGEYQTDRYVDELDVFLERGGPCFPLSKNFEKFTAGKLSRSCRKGCVPPKHHFFEICQVINDLEKRLKVVLDSFLLSLKKELLQTIHAELPAFKTRRNILFFDDLLLRLRDVLGRPEGDLLAAAIRRKYRAALIDEFQDTDPVQYAILQAAFLCNRPEESDKPPIFLIGDPKQAIYSFRGADIFAYMAAAKQVDAAYTLQENWRSAPALLNAVNSVFHSHPNPFVYEAISFMDSKPAPGGQKEQLILAGPDEWDPAPLQLWVIPDHQKGGKVKPLGKGHATPGILQAVTAEISHLLDAGRKGMALIGNRRIEAGDVAVLVRSNREARLIQQALLEGSIPAVMHSRDNLFDSLEATDMDLLLRAIEVPNDERRLGAAMMTSLLGLSIGALYRLKIDERQWENCLQRFRNYHRQWQEAGFMRMMRSLLRIEDIRSRLLSQPDGERRLTNVLHLAEVLHRESLERNRGMRGLIRWLAEMRDPGKTRSDEHQLRLESDARAVRVVTIHKSKGLEYPVVFCPFVWEGAKNVSKNDALTCHGGDENSFLLCDLGLPHQALHELRAYREGLAERVRLLYVALTRAKHRCYLVWGHFNGAGGSAPAYLFHDRTSKWDENNPEEAIAAAASSRNFYNELTGPEILRDLDRIADSAHGSISIADLPVPTAVTPLPNEHWKGTLSRRNFTRKLEQSWRFTSFSSLVFGTYVPQEGADRDREEEYRPLKSSDWQVLPPGTQTGNLLHEFLEHLDFKERDEMVLQQRASEALSSHGFDSRWKTALLTLIRNVLALSLSGGGNGQSFRLSDICLGDRISELAFYFPLKRLTRDNLRILFQEISREDPGTVPDSWDLEMERLSFSPIRGWLRGFIDLVFVIDGRYYLLDWKSNFLGADPSGYSPEALKSVMVRKHYILQYHLYALALHAYLKQRLPGYRVERHFGGIYYLFLRGIDPSRGEKTGVYFDRPSEARLTALYDGLIEKNPAERRNADVA